MFLMHARSQGRYTTCTPSAYHDATRAILGGMPGMMWDPARKCYHGPTRAARLACDLLQAAEVCKVQWDEHQGAYYDLAFDPPQELRVYQHDGVRWLVRQLRYSGGALLADEMGLGKTAQAIAAIEALQLPGRVLVCCPAIVVQHWEAQITKWATQFGTDAELPAEVPTRKAERAVVQEDQRHWVVLSHDMVEARMRKGTMPTNIAAVVLDELHAYSNPKAKRTVAMREWLDGERVLAHVQAVMGLSGTPMTTRPRDLWSPLDLLHPGDWGKKWIFEKRYCNGHREELQVGAQKRDIWVADGISNPEELAARLEDVMLRRTKAQVALELPILTRQIIEVQPGKTSSALKLHMGVDHPRTEARPAAMHIGDLLAQAESGKLDHALELAREVIANGGRPLLLTLRRASVEYLASRLGVNGVTGDTPAGERASVLQAEGAPAGVATLASVTTGIDLIAFDTVIMVGLDWVPSTMLQGEARAHRLGQLRAVTVYYLVALGTVDEQVRERVIDRLDTFATLTGGDATGGMGQLLRGGTEDEILADLAAQIMGG